LLVVVLLVAGLLLAWLGLEWTQFRQTAAAPFALLVGVIAFYLLTAHQRAIFGADFARASRYAHVSAALLLPALAVAADAIIRRWRVAAGPLFVVVLLSISGNIHAFDPTPSEKVKFERREAVTEAVAWSPATEELPPTARPLPQLAGFGPTAGWLVESRDKIPKPAVAELADPERETRR
jgi:hypothetical protein